MESEALVVPLRRGTVVEICAMLRHHAEDGLLDLQSETTKIRITWEGGEMTAAVSTATDRALAIALLKEGAVEQEAMKAALAARKPGVSLADHLVDAGLVEPSRCADISSRVVRATVEQAFAFPSGAGRFTAAESPSTAAGALDMRTTDLLFHGGSAMLDQSGLARLLGTTGDLVVAPDARGKIDAIAMDDSLRELFSSLEPGTTLPRAETGLPADALAGAVAAGILMGAEGLVDLAEYLSALKGAAGGGRRRKKRKIKWVKPKAPKIDFTDEDVRIMREKIVRKAKKLDGMNLYEILECPVRTTQKEIHFAYLNLGSFYHPDLASDRRFADLAPTLAKIYEKMEKAYLVLVNYESRMQYDRTIPRAFLFLDKDGDDSRG